MTGNGYKFEKLTPINNAELKIYDDAINHVFKNDDIKNVAISGAYSAGKSSIIESYKKKHSDIKFMNISLAHFESTDSESSSPIEINRTALEGKILNQLIHQIDPNKIPLTHFRVKKTSSNWRNIVSTLIILMFSIFSLYMLNFKNWTQFVSSLSIEWLKSRLFWSTNSAMLLISGVICSVIIGSIVYLLIKTEKYGKVFKKVKLKDYEIEIFEENNESYFDKYLNEVLYIFRNSAADVIVFEDMDRYNVNQIFEKLREINTLVNIKKKKSIRFFYLLRDDIFVSKDRTKFFDFIIPVVPVIDSSNSFDQFIELFNRGGILEIFEYNFLQDLSLYVDDMRILKNIYNEFVIYHNRIQSTELNSNKLLAIITYKNIFPRDFSDLQLGLGFVHTLFENKNEFIKQEIQNIDLKIQNATEDISLSSRELLNSIDELDATYLLNKRHIIEVNGVSISAFKTNVELVKAIKKNPNNINCYNPGNYSSVQISLKSELDNFMQNPEYIVRKNAIETKMNNKMQKLKDEIQSLENYKSTVRNKKLREIITKENINDIFKAKYINEIGEENNFEEIKASPYFSLIKYLMRNGYIDETYPDYMTYFYENSISRIDKIFLRSVTDEIPKEYAYSLKNPKLVLSRLRIIDFDQEETLNFDLLNYLLETKQSNLAYLTRFLQQIIKTRNYRFIGEFIATQRNKDIFVEHINHLWPDIFHFIHTESDFSDKQKKQYAMDTLYFSPEIDIVSVNVEGCISEYISQTPTFLDITEPNVKKIIDGFSIINVKFEHIEYSTSNSELFYEVYKNNQYQLSFELITLMLEKIYNYSSNDDFKNKNFTLICSKPDESLVSYVNENINYYISVILENCDNIVNDEEKVVLAILNNEQVEYSNREKYINYLQTTVNCIEDIGNTELWSLLLQQNKVAYSEMNILNYFFLSGNELDTSLIEFVNANFNDLNFNCDLIDTKFGGESASIFFESIVSCNQLSNKKYEEIILSLHFTYSSFEIKELPDDKIKILIKNNIIQMSVENLQFLRQNYPDHINQFIVRNISEYTNNIINKEILIISEILSLLEENIDDTNKIKLLELVDDKISIQGKILSDEVQLHILNYNFEIKDIPFLLQNYSNQSEDIKKVIKYIIIENISVVISNQNIINFEFLSELITSEQLTFDIKIELFLISLTILSEEEAKHFLSSLKLRDFLRLFDQKRPKVKIDTLSKRLLDIFMDKCWIKGYENDKYEPDFYRVFGLKAN